MKEKTADEMFEELGYEKKLLNIPWYIKKLFKNNYIQITFDIIDKTVAVSNDKGEAINLDMQELQAINKKCQELRLDMKQWKEIKGYERAIYNK